MVLANLWFYLSEQVASTLPGNTSEMQTLKPCLRTAEADTESELSILLNKLNPSVVLMASVDVQCRQKRILKLWNYLFRIHICRDNSEVVLAGGKSYLGT